jgi:hypothetical protein
MGGAQRRLLGWLGAGVGLLAASLASCWIWLTRIADQPGDLRLIAGGLGLLSLVMALRCARLAWPARERRASG